MTTRRRVIERRLFEAVMLVVAGASCYSSSPPSPGPRPPRPVPPRPDDRQTRTEVPVTDPWAKPPPDHEKVVTPPPPPPPHHTTTNPPPPAPPNAVRVCAGYKHNTQAPRAVPPVPRPLHGGSPISDRSHWDAAKNAAQCVIVRDTQTGNIEVTYTPRCCPSPDPRVTQTCPRPTTSMVMGTILLVEHATVGADGSVIASALSWRGIAPREPQQPYCGRLPEGALAVGDPSARDRAIADHLAAMAELEAASIPAFERLARELAAHGAPAQLVRRARAAMREEIRHARTMRALAIRHGAMPRDIAVPELPVRDLAAIAHENVVEGCTREAFGALVATYQGESAPPDVRPVFQAIARDERRHASLAEDVHTWLSEKLDDDARAALDRARTAAEDELRASLAAMTACDDLGMPGAPHAVALFDAYFGAAHADREHLRLA